MKLCFRVHVKPAISFKVFDECGILFVYINYSERMSSHLYMDANLVTLVCSQSVKTEAKESVSCVQTPHDNECRLSIGTWSRMQANEIGDCSVLQ